MSMDFANSPIINNYGKPMLPYQQQVIQQPVQTSDFETPKIVAGGATSFIKVIKNDQDKKSGMIPVDPPLSDMEIERKKRGRPRKDESGNSTEIVRAESTVVEDTPTAYTYMETTKMLYDSLNQIDLVNSALMQEFEMVRNNRALKGKYNILNGLSENIGSLINNRITAIREINSSISKANELDYKRDKDRKAANANMDDDKYIADLYKSFMQNPINMAPTPQVPQVDPSIFGSGIVRADLKSGDYNGNGPVDMSYLNYVSNLTPEQNLMRYEGNNNVKQVVVFDASTGNKFFQYMDLSTMQVIPNVQTYDQMFMEDTTIDLKNKVARNINLNETFPLIVINEGVTSQY